MRFRSRYRLLGKRCDRTPGDGVVNVDRHRIACLHRLDEGVDHEEVHAAMAVTLGLGAKPLPERMVVSVEPGLGRLPLMRLRPLALYVDGLIDRKSVV